MAKGPGGFSVGRVSIQVVPDTSKFRQQLLRELKKETKGIKVEVPVEVNAKRALTQLRALDAVTKRLDGRNINIGASVNSKGDLDKLSKNLSKVGDGASQAADGFSRMSRFALIATAVVLLLAPALALIATLLAGLPSLMAAFGFAALAVGLGIEGIKKAAQGFAPTIDRLKASLSATFAKQLTQPFIELNKIAPVLDSGLNKIAVSLSNIITDLIRFTTSVQGMELLNTILQNTADFFEQLRPAFADGFRAFFQLAAAASAEFGNLASTLNRFAQGFLTVVNSADQSGLLTAALRNLNLVLDSLLTAFNRLFEAGLKAMTVLGTPIKTLFDGFTDAVVALMPVLTAISKLVFEVLGEAFKQLVPIVQALTPAIQTLGQLLGQILVGALRALGPLLTIVAQIINDVLLQAFTALAPFIQPFINFLTDFAMILGQFLVEAFKALNPFLGVFFKFIQDLFLALAPLMPVLLQFATEVLRAIADILKELGPELTHMGQELFPRLLTAIKDVVPVATDFLRVLIDVLPIITTLASLILDIAVPAFVAMFQTVSEIWPGIKAIIESGMLFLQGFINLIMGLITGDWSRAWNGLKQIFQGSIDLLKNGIRLGLTFILDLFIGLPTRIIQALAGLPSSLFSSGRAMLQGFIDGAVSMAQTAVNKVKAVVDRVRGLFPFSPAKYGPFSGTGYTTYSGRHLMEDWAKGIEDGTPTAVSAVEEAMAATQTGMDIGAAVSAEGFGDIQSKIVGAMSGWEVVIDANGITKMVNKTNNANRRR